jgi:sugar phosphate isomerase/epimerase
MIVSVSYRTDIPAFYGAWFMNRLAAGYCRVVNPMGGPAYVVPLTPEAVDGFVFWTRNAAPFLASLEAIRQRGYPFVVHLTITGYPRALEASVLEAERLVAQARHVAHRFGRRVVVWRYDPILHTSLTPPAWHRENFRRLAGTLAGATDEVIVSFAHLYAKTRRNLAVAASRHGFAWHDGDGEEKRALLRDLAAVAADCGLRLSLCAQPEYAVEGTHSARCIDAERLADVGQRPVTARRKGNRPGCACAESRDIGAYDSCPHGCVYCYAVQSPAAAKRRHRTHDPDGEYLIPPPAIGRREPKHRGQGRRPASEASTERYRGTANRGG